MKKIARIFFYSLLSLAVLCFFLPYAVKLKPVQARLTDILHLQLGIQADVDDMGWKWLPFPQIVLYNVSLVDDLVKIAYPHGAVGLGLARSIRFQPTVKLIADRPQIVFKSLSQTGKRDEKQIIDQRLRPPFVFLQIKKGHLLLPPDGVLEKFATEKAQAEIFDINADIALSPEGVEVKSTGRFSFADKILAHIRLEKNRSASPAMQKDLWQLDIRGENIDLTGARKKMLMLFGKHKTAQKIFDVVRGGRIKTGNYLFNGPAEDFKDLTAMKILLQADDVDILVPKVRLPLKHGTGPVVIEDGILTGHSLSVRLGTSSGQNGQVRIDLLKRNRAFEVDADVDADVKELRGWLINNLLVRHERVANELEKISAVRGRARGHLHIGGSSRHPVIKADVAESDSRIEYERFNYPVEIKSGLITIYQDRLTWDDASGGIGSQRIDSSRGAVKWSDGVQIDVDELIAHLDARSLLEEKLVRQALEKTMTSLIDAADGGLDIKHAEIHGPVNDFRKLSYNFNIDTDDLMVDSPLLPDIVRVTASGVRVTENRFVMPTGRIDTSDRQLTLQTDIAHDLWHDFSGRLTIKGIIGPQIARWVKTKHWVPDRFFPKIPCVLGPLTVSWNKKEKNVTGTIIPGSNEKNVVSSRLDLSLSEGRLALKELSITSMDESADMWFFLERGLQPSFKGGFKGSLKKETLDVLLEDNQFLTGSVSGDCEMVLNLNHVAAHRLTGDINVSWASLFFKGSRVLINSAVISGDESSVKIKRADLRINDESVMIDGRVYFPDEADIKTELNVTSRKLSAGNLNHFFGDLKDLLFGPVSPTKPALEREGLPSKDRPKTFSATGIINVDIKELLFNPERHDSPVPVKQFIGHDLSGTISLGPDNRIVATLTSGEVCNVKVSGTVGLPPEKTVLTLETDPEHKPEVQDLLDCLGVTDREMSGKYVLQAVISGTSGNWTDGHIKFKARKGRMKGLAVISKILTLVNVTELFSINVFKNFFTMGYPYKDMKLSGTITDNILTLEETQIIGEGLDIFFEGTVDLSTTALDMVAYVKPFKMVDSIVTLIPYVGKDLGDGEKSIAYIPFKIKGDIDNPDVFLVFEDKRKGNKP